VSALAGNMGAWLKGDGPESEIVFSTRFRLARNVEGFRFKSRMTPDEEILLESFLSERVVDSTFGDGMQYVKLNDISKLDRRLLVERHLISMDHYKGTGPRAVAYDRNHSVSIMVNEEDHLRIQVIGSGLALGEQLNRINGIDDVLADRLTYCFDSDFGYLTACPTNVGTGLRVSVMLHLPALGISKHIQKVFNAVTKVNLAVRGFFGEGSQAVGDFYQISNQVTLGMAPEEVLGELNTVLPKVIDYERDVRKVLIQDDRKVLEDRIWRGYAILKSARSISSDETMAHLSSVKMGIHFGILDDLTVDMVNKLFLITQPAHIQMSVGKELNAAERDVARAALIRKELQKV